MSETRHAGHELVRVRGWRESGEEVGLLLCLDCARAVRRLALCGATTQRGRACRAFVANAPGSARCRQHSDGAPRPPDPLPARRSPASGLWIGSKLSRSERGKLC